MKKLYTLFIFSVITFSAFSQAYRPMLKENKTWDVDISSSAALGEGQPYCYTNHTEAFISGDTLVAGNNYFKLYYYNLAFPCIPNPIGGIHPNIFDTTYLFSGTLMREDTLMRKIWARGINDTQDYLIYDFSVNVGDTMFSSPCFFWSSSSCGSNFFHELLIDSIGTTTLVNGEVTRVFYGTPLNFYQFNSPFFVIEGVGTPDGFVAPFEDEFEIDFSLECVKDENEIIFSQNGNCGWFVGVNESLEEKSSFEIFPNPNNGESVSISGEDIDLIKIYNIHGQLIKTIKTQDDETLINMENQSKGIYIVKAQFENGEISTQKLMLTR